MIVLQKGNSKTASLGIKEAQELLDKGWTVFINKTGKKLVKPTKKKSAKK